MRAREEHFDWSNLRSSLMREPGRRFPRMPVVASYRCQEGHSLGLGERPINTDD